MKVVIISDYSVDQPYGGLQTHVYHLARSISMNSIETHIITFSDRKDEIKKGNLNIHFINRLSRIPRLFTVLYESKMVKNKVEEIDPDLVHVQGTHYPYNYISLDIPDRYPVLITVHGIMAKEYKFNKGLNFFGGFVSSLIEKHALRKSKNIIVCSEVMKKEIKKLTNAKIYIVPNGIDFKEIECNNAIKHLKHPSIFYIGLLEKIKGVDVLIKAIELLKKQIPDICLYIAGKGSEEKNLKNLAKKFDLENNILFLGYISEDKKYSYFKAVDLVVVPSRYESFGIVILEAMACGKPVVASDVGNIPSLVNKDVGFKFKLENEKDLAIKIKLLMKDQKLRYELGLNAKKRIRRFNWNKIAEKTLEVYKEHVNKNA